MCSSLRLGQCLRSSEVNASLTNDVAARLDDASLAVMLDRVPRDFWPRISHVFVFDDGSGGSTYFIGLGAARSPDSPPKVFHEPVDRGYGGNQKAGYLMAIEEQLEIIVFLHGDSKNAPESLPEIVAPLENREADAVIGSRMIESGAGAWKGRLPPLHRHVGNRLLTSFENRMLGTSLSEFHSGYRAYRVDALDGIEFERNSDGFSFDTQIIIQLIDARKRIVEVPIPTYYGNEIGYAQRLRCARDVSTDVVRYRLGKLGFDFGGLGVASEEYALKLSDSSHAIILRWLAERGPANLLDLGCSGGQLSERMRALGHRITGVDVLEIEGVRDRVDQFVQADLDRGLPREIFGDGPYDIVVCADNLEHVRQPERLLRELHEMLAPGGVVIASVPNFGHWYARLRTLFGLFDYDHRGVLDNGHVRFFTRRGLMRRFERAGYIVVRQETTGLPLDVLSRDRSELRRVVRGLDRRLIGMRPSLFGYQFVSMCEPGGPFVRQGTSRRRGAS